MGLAMLALALADQDRLHEAAQSAAGALARSPLDPNLANLCASIALRQGQAEAALEFSRRALAIDPHDQRALSDLILALRQSGAFDQASLLGDADRLAVLSNPAPPKDFGSTEAFNAALAAAILDCGALKPAQPGVTMAGGARLADVFTLDRSLAEALRQMLLEGVAAYPTETRLPIDHPVATGRPARSRLVGWANVLGPGDFERAHIHEAGWLSGVYYVRMPAAGGDIRLGGHHHATLPFAEPSRTIRPRAGQLLLFPSYLHHGTQAFEGAGQRISVAFDVLRD